MTAWLPTVEHVLRLHGMLIKRTGGLDGIRDRGLIESALTRAQASYGGYELYPGVVDKAAAVCCGLIMNHGFVDGNKRIGIATLLLILSRNGIPLAFIQNELVLLGMSVAEDTMDIEGVVTWIHAHLASP